MHLIGFIIRIYHDAWSYECQKATWHIHKHHTRITLCHPHLHTSHLHHTILSQRLQVHACIYLLIAQHTLSTADRHVFYERLANHARLPNELVLAIFSQRLEFGLSLKYSIQSI